MKFLAVGTAFLAMALAAPTDKDYKGDGKEVGYKKPGHGEYGAPPKHGDDYAWGKYPDGGYEHGGGHRDDGYGKYNSYPPPKTGYPVPKGY